MIIVHPTSLSDTLDSAEETFFFHRSIVTSLREDLASLIISRQILTGSNSGVFIPFASESRTQIRLFTGETLHTEFACRHLQLIEATRVLSLLALDNPAVSRSISLSNQRMNTMCYSQFCSKGECRSLTVAYMRFLASLNTNDASSHLNQLLAQLESYRDGKGKWHGFPYYYTILMLSETDDPKSADELQYTAPVLDRMSGQKSVKDRYSIRCQSIFNNVFARSEHNAHPLFLGQYG